MAGQGTSFALTVSGIAWLDTVIVAASHQLSTNTAGSFDDSIDVTMDTLNSTWERISNQLHEPNSFTLRQANAARIAITTHTVPERTMKVITKPNKKVKLSPTGCPAWATKRRQCGHPVVDGYRHCEEHLRKATDIISFPTGKYTDEVLSLRASDKDIWTVDVEFTSFCKGVYPIAWSISVRDLKNNYSIVNSSFDYGSKTFRELMKEIKQYKGRDYKMNRHTRSM